MRLSQRISISTLLLISLSLVSSQTGNSQIRAKQRRPSSQPSLTAREIARRTMPSVVLILTRVGRNSVAQGSGFFVTEDLIATNYHVIKGASEISIKMMGQKNTYEVTEIVTKDEERDLVLLRAEGVKSKPLPLANSTISIGDQVFVISSPEGLEGTFSQGIVSALRGKDYIQITAPVSHGSSGGPVVNERGEVIGVTVGGIEEGQNLNFAIPIHYLIAKLNNSDETPAQAADNNENTKVGVSPIGTKNQLPKTAEEWFELGRNLYFKSNNKDAINAYQQAIHYNPKYVEAYSELCLVYSMEDNFVAGEKACQQAIRLNPNYAEAYANLGLNYYLSKRYEEAVSQYKRSVQIEPTNAYYHDQLAEVYAKLNKDQDAYREYKEAIRLEPKDFLYYVDLGKLFEKLNQLWDAADAYKQAITLNPKGNYLHFLLGNAYVKIGNRLLWLEEFNYLKDKDVKFAARLLLSANDSGKPSNWELVAGTDDRFFYIDERQISRTEGGVVKAWVREIPFPTKDVVKERRDAGLPIEGYYGYSHSLTLYEFHCSERTMLVASFFDYSVSGKVLDETSSGGTWGPVVPDSIGEAILEFACKSANGN